MIAHCNLSALLTGIVLCGSALASLGAPLVDGITFAAAPGTVFVPLDEAAGALRWPLAHDPERKVLVLNRRDVPLDSLRRLVDGTELVSLADLQRAGARIKPDSSGWSALVSARFRHFTVAVGPKRTEISLRQQKLRAWQGRRLVLETRISS
ncbi:MAG: hypothetical protein HKO57_01035, partial [Akkermansiaceae bacterium]|nr:hypothetical protein [Akkermansiaceae bacterium]